MEKVILNPGYHYVAQKILNNLNSQSLFALSQTNKEIKKVCENFIIAKECKRPIFETLKCQMCEEVFTDTFQDFVTFVKKNEICYVGFFKSVTSKEDKEDVLVQFLEKLSEVMRGNRNFLLLEKLTTQHRGICGNRINILHLIRNTLHSFLQKYVKFIPSKFPVESKKHLLMILNQAVRWEDLEMVKMLLASLKNQDTCLRLTISAMESKRFKHETLEAHLKWMNDKAPFIEKIASQCKNPNAPNKFGYTALHLVVKLGLDKIAKVLVPFSNNLDARNKYGKNALDYAKEEGNFEILKMLKSAIRARSLEKSLTYESGCKI